jgi:PKD repeat protein
MFIANRFAHIKFRKIQSSYLNLRGNKMKVKYIFSTAIFVFLFISANLFAQSLLNGAESVAFDTLNNRYLVSSLNDQKIVEMTPDGTQSIYMENIGAFGNCIQDNIFYISSGNTKGVKGINLVTNEIVMDVEFPDAQQLDGVTTDDSGNLYVVETIAGIIYKLNLSDLSTSVFAGTGDGRFPQDIIYDKFQNRLLLCYWHDKSPVVSFDLTTGSADTVVITDTGFFDGITIDDDGNVYLASHVGDGKIVMYDNGFTNGGHIIYEGIDEPAGLDFNSKDKTLAVPSFAGNEVVLIDLPAVYLNGEYSADVTSGHAPLSVEFSSKYSSSNENVEWHWDFNNDGVIDSFEEHPNFTYSETGTYDVKLTLKADALEREILYPELVKVFNGESALQFSTNQDAVNIEATDNLELTDEWTIEAWINPTELNRQAIFDKEFISLYTNKNKFGKLRASSLAVRFKLADGSTKLFSTLDSTISTNQWQHIAVSYSYANKYFNVFINGKSMEISIDDSLLFLDKAKENITSNISLGYTSNLNAGFNGMMDELRIWSTYRNENQIQELMEENLTGNESGLNGYWDFDEGWGISAADKTTNVNHGTIAGPEYVQGLDFTIFTDMNDFNDTNTEVPDGFILMQNYPNPFNPSTIISFRLFDTADIHLQVYSINGEVVKNLAKGSFKSGTHLFEWNGQNDKNYSVSSGLYFYQLKIGNKVTTKKMLLVR